MSGLGRVLQRDLLARRAQFAAVGLTILVGVALFGASFDGYRNLSASYLRLYDDLAFADLTIRAADPGSVEAAVAGLDGVAATEIRTVADLPMAVDGAPSLGRLVGQPTDREPAVDRVRVLDGRGLGPDRPDGVLVERHMADHFGLHPGDTISLPGSPAVRLTIVGVVASPEYLWPARSRQDVLTLPGEFGVVFAPEALVAARPAHASLREVLVRFRSGAADDTEARVSTAALAAGAAIAIPRADQPSNAALQEDVSGLGELAVGFPLMFLGAAALATSILLGRLVASRRAQIGVLLASGFERRAILRHYLAFGLAIGLVGAVPGAILGALLATLLTSVYTGVLGIPASVVEVRPDTILVGLVLGPIAGAVAAYGPARAAARLDPAQAMRGANLAGRGGRSLAERLVPPLRRLPIRWLTAIRGLGRNRRRTVSSVLGIALAAMLVFVSWGLVDTVQVLLDRQFRDVQRSDAALYLAAPSPADAVVGEVAAIPGVAAAEPALELAATLANGDRRYSTTLVGLPRGTSMHGFRRTDGGSDGLPEGGLLLGVALRSELGLAVGDSVAIQLDPATDPAVGAPSGPRAEIRLPVAGFVDEPLGTFAYAALAVVARAAGLDPDRPSVGTVLVRYEPGVDREVMRMRLAALPGVAGQADTQALFEAAESLLGLFYAFVGAMLVLGGVMAFALIFNTMSANVAERSTELAALRTLGLSKGAIGRLVTAENVLLTLVGLVPGLVGGYVVAAAFMASFSSDLFRFDLQVRPTTFLGTALAILVVALLSQGPSLRAVGRIDLGRLVRERSL